MADNETIHSTFVIERTYRAPPARVFDAFADSAKKRRWFAERGTQQVVRYDLDFRVGGRETLIYKLGENTPLPGVEVVNEMTFADIAPARRIVFTQTMAMRAKAFSVALITMEILANGQGADLICTHQAVFLEGGDGPQRREQGWAGLLKGLGEELDGETA